MKIDAKHDNAKDNKRLMNSPKYYAKERHIIKISKQKYWVQIVAVTLKSKAMNQVKDQKVKQFIQKCPRYFLYLNYRPFFPSQPKYCRPNKKL